MVNANSLLLNYEKTYYIYSMSWLKVVLLLT